MDRAPDKTSLFEGAFGFETFLCQLFRQIDPIAELNRERPVNDFVLTRMAKAARRMSDVWVPLFLDETIRSATRDVLFHERVHYWQLLSASAMQRQTVNSLAHLQLAIKADGGKSMVVWGGVPGLPDDVVRDAIFLYENFNSSGVSVFHNYERLQLHSDTSATLQRVLLGLDLETLIEGYVVDLGFGENHATVVRVPLVGRNLLESAAYVSETLFKGEEVPPMAGSGDPDDVLYKGAWEVWRRANSRQYESPESLALSFLAAVDLAVSPELNVGANREIQPITIPWRFGRILLAAPQLPPLDLAGGSADRSVSDFQDRCCLALNWRTPTEVALEMATYLTQVYAPLLGTKDNLEIAQAFHKRPIREVGLDELTPILQLINKGGEPDLIGLRVIRSMINASFYRLFNPGKFALPHVYADELNKSFPLPAILYEGNFYFDGSPDGAGRVLNVDPLDYWSDCVRMMTVDHLRYTPPSESLSCGFVRRDAECPYMAFGAGCPKRGLSQADQLIRQRVGLDADWCHWKVTAIVVGLIPLDANASKAPPEFFEARPQWTSVQSPEAFKALLEVYRKLWQEMSEEQRRQAVAASAEMKKGLSDEEQLSYVDVWAVISSQSANE